jgi:hypothetical protein
MSLKILTRHQETALFTNRKLVDEIKVKAHVRVRYNTRTYDQLIQMKLWAIQKIASLMKRNKVSISYATRVAAGKTILLLDDLLDPPNVKVTQR